MRKTRIIGALGGVLLTVSLSACASIETAPDEVAIRYNGGAVMAEAETFANCVAPGSQEYGSAGDHTEYVYPAGQRTLKFSNDPGSDAPPLKVSAPAPGGGQPITMDVSGLVTFTPNFQDCDALRKFHETIGRKYKAYLGSDDAAPQTDGWAKMIGVYIKDPTDRAADNAALADNWVQLTSNADAKGRWEKRVADELIGVPDANGVMQPGLVEKLAGGKFFTINTVLLQRPDLPVDVQNAIAQSEAERQRAVTAEQFKAAAESFPGGAPAYQEFQRQLAVNKAIESGQVKIIPVPQGSPVIVGQGG
jgi:hypothetical protein